MMLNRLVICAGLITACRRSAANLPRASGGGPELDDYDELWVLHDRLLFDDELYALMARFRPPTRVVVIADSCHAGTSFKIQPGDGATPAGGPISRLLDREIAADVVARHKKLYDGILAQLPTTKPAVDFVGLAACQDNESAFEENGNGAFTRALLDLLNSGFDTSYLDLVEAAAALTPHQHPRPFWYDKTTLLHQTVFA